MLIGLISDTHDRIPATAALTSEFSKAGVKLILHAGDHCSPFSLAPFMEANIPVAGVFGFNDGDPEGLRAYATMGVGIELYESPHSVEVSGNRILLVHDIADVSDLSLGSHSIVVHGHSHSQEMKTRGDTLILNPGEGCGWLHGAPSAALLNINDKHVEFIKLTGAEWQR